MNEWKKESKIITKLRLKVDLYRKSNNILNYIQITACKYVDM